MNNNDDKKKKEEEKEEEEKNGYHFWNEICIVDAVSKVWSLSCVS